MHAATGDRGYCDIWESSLTVRLSNPHMRKQENMVEKMERNM